MNILKTLVAGAFVTLAFYGVPTFAEGNVSYVLHKSDNPTEDELDAYEHIVACMDSALYYYNKYTDLTKFINVYYSTGVPTAEASSNGDLRFGSSRSYMYVGTAMHEIAHTMGMGTTSDYQSMMVNGVFQGEKAQALLKEIDGEDAELHGDSQHFWPYGLNYSSEVKSEQDLINHAKIVNAMYQDIFKEAFYFAGHLQNVATGKCMGITSENALKMMDCSDTATFIKMFSVGDAVAYRIQLGARSLDVPNESTASGVTLGTYGYNGGAHQKMYKSAVSAADTSIFYLQIVKSSLFVKAGESDLKQESKTDNDKAYQWTWYKAQSNEIATPENDELNKDSTEAQSIQRKKIANRIQYNGNSLKKFDLLGRTVLKAHRMLVGRPE